MGWIVITVILGIIAAISLFLVPWMIGSVYDGDGEKTPGWVGLIGVVVAGFVVVVWLGATALFSVRFVGAGHVGLEKGIAGTYVGQVGEGTHFIAPWKSLEVVSIQTQEFRSPGTCSDGEKNCLDAFTKDNNDAFVVGSLNWHVDPDKIQDLYRTYPNFEKTIIETRFSQAVKDETVRYTAEEIAPNREQIRLAVRDRLRDELQKYSISADDFLLPNIEFRDELKQKFEAKAQAKVDADTETNRVQVSVAQAQQATEKAKGDANVLRETAQGQADANRTLTASLTPLLVQYQAIQKLGDKIQIALIPSGQGLILDPATLLKPQQ